jgi:DNA polymerase
MAQFNPLFWLGFLPARTTIMTRTAQPSHPSPAEPTSGESGPCLSNEATPKVRLLFVSHNLSDEKGSKNSPTPHNETSLLLDKMIEAMGIPREEVAIAYLNLNPNENTDSLSAITQRITSLQPEVIVTLGENASQTLLKTQEQITQLRGRFYEASELIAPQGLSKVKIMPTFHPAYLLRNPTAKKQTWLDLQQVVQSLGLTIPNRK